MLIKRTTTRRILAGNTTIVRTTNNIDDNDLIHKSAMFFDSSPIQQRDLHWIHSVLTEFFSWLLRSTFLINWPNRRSGTGTQLTPETSGQRGAPGVPEKKGSWRPGFPSCLRAFTRIVRALHARLDDRLGKRYN